MTLTWKASNDFFSLLECMQTARIVDVAPARIDLSGLPKGVGFKFEFKTTRLAEKNIQPIMDRVELHVK